MSSPSGYPASLILYTSKLGKSTTRRQGMSLCCFETTESQIYVLGRNPSPLVPQFEPSASSYLILHAVHLCLFWHFVLLRMEGRLLPWATKRRFNPMRSKLFLKHCSNRKCHNTKIRCVTFGKLRVLLANTDLLWVAVSHGTLRAEDSSTRCGVLCPSKLRFSFWLWFWNNSRRHQEYDTSTKSLGYLGTASLGLIFFLHWLIGTGWMLLQWGL